MSLLCVELQPFRIYARNKKLDALMFESLRIVVSGAEKLKNEVRTTFEMKFKKAFLKVTGLRKPRLWRV